MPGSGTSRLKPGAGQPEAYTITILRIGALHFRNTANGKKTLCIKKLSGFDDSAGDAVSAVARRISHLVVRPGVNDKRGAILREQRGRPRRKRDPVSARIHVPFAVLIDYKIRQVPRMRAVRVLEAVMLAHRVIMPACRRERRAAVTGFMDMDAVLARRNSFYVDVYMYRSVTILGELCGPYLGAIDIFKDCRGIRHTGICA